MAPSDSAIDTESSSCEEIDTDSDDSDYDYKHDYEVKFNNDEIVNATEGSDFSDSECF